MPLPIDLERQGPAVWAPYAEPANDRGTLFGGDAQGLTDYPALAQAAA